MSSVVYSTIDRPEPEEYKAFLRCSGLGDLYPRHNFDARIASLLEHADVIVTARRDDELIGVCLGVTDWTYFLFITDLGVARNHERTGIGRELLRRLCAAVGDPKDITVVTWSNAQSLPFYAACGFQPDRCLVGREATAG